MVRFNFRPRVMFSRRTVAQLLLFLLAGSIYCGCASSATDVTHDLTQQFGWMPGETYQLTSSEDLVRLEGTREYDFIGNSSYNQPIRPVGSVCGSIDNHDLVVVWIAPPGTRFKVVKLTRYLAMFVQNTTQATAYLLDGPYVGERVELENVSSYIDPESNHAIAKPGRSVIPASQPWQ